MQHAVIATATLTGAVGSPVSVEVHSLAFGELDGAEIAATSLESLC